MVREEGLAIYQSLISRPCSLFPIPFLGAIMFSHSLKNTQIGEYQIVAYLGAGGMGEVYRGVHRKLGREVAIKILSRAESQQNLVARFFNEARIQASLQHSAIATLYDYLEFNHYPYIVMEFLDGQTLDEILHNQGVLPLPETLRIFKAVVEAVAYLHNHEIVHRDIKANNIKLTSTGAVKLLDFGISKSATTPQFTEVGNVIGTWHYLSPEQIFAGRADAKSDLWALGILLYEMVTGALPFEATTLGNLTEKIKQADYLSPSVLNQSIPKEIETIIVKCLRKNPAERYQSAQDLLHDVEQINLTPAQPSAIKKQYFPQRMKMQSFLPLLQQVKKVKVAAALLGLPLLTLTLWFGLFAAPGEEKIKAAELAAPLKTVRVRLFQGQADVYRNGNQIGSTPIETKAIVNERLALVLKCAGCQDSLVHIPVSEDETKNEFIYQMQAAEPEK